MFNDYELRMRREIRGAIEAMEYEHARQMSRRFLKIKDRARKARRVTLLNTVKFWPSVMGETMPGQRLDSKHYWSKKRRLP